VAGLRPHHAVAKRHPTLGDGVVLGTAATVVVGSGSIVGAHAVVLRSLPAQSRVAPGRVVQRAAAADDTEPPVLPRRVLPRRDGRAPGGTEVTTTTGGVLITCAPPNPNGDLHLGHLSGAFFGADVLRRYLIARGASVSYVSYTDDHSCYIPRRGAEIG
jgi:hypothetical protein